MRKFKNLDPMVFSDEYGRLQCYAFEVLNNTWNDKRYGDAKIFRDGVNMISRHFEMINTDYYTHRQVVEHLEEIRKLYYKILDLRKKMDMKNKLKRIKEDF